MMLNETILFKYLLYCDSPTLNENDMHSTTEMTIKQFILKFAIITQVQATGMIILESMKIFTS